MKRFLFLSFLLSTNFLYSQDTIRIMHYNLLYYGINSSFCNATNNNETDKNGYLKTIVQYIKPDILTVNEISSDPDKHLLLLNNALNVDGVSYYQKCNYSNVTGSDLSNELYYDTLKLGLYSQHNIATSVRDINFYSFYFKAEDLSSNNDTAFLTCIVAHLKAGNTSGDEIEREAATDTLMGYLNYLGVQDNYMVMGDFNVYSSNENCFQNLVNYSNPDIRFYDPVNMLGAWHEDSTYSAYHTQSTHTVSTGCPATGGMDDRFDYILISALIKNGIDHFQYIPTTYRAIGQDGNHFNSAINSGTNNSAPADVISALWNLSDHLPVTLDLLVDQTTGVNNIPLTDLITVIYPNPVTDNLQIQTALQINKAEITDITGRLLYTTTSKTLPSRQAGIDCSGFAKGVYFVRIETEKGVVVKKFMKE